MTNLFDFLILIIIYDLYFLASFMGFLVLQLIVYKITGYSLYNMKYIKKRN